MNPEPLPSSAPESEQENEKKLPIKTYHCRFCSHLLIASTRELLSPSTPLRRRRLATTTTTTTSSATEGGAESGVGGLDGALILEVGSGNTTRAHKKRKSYDENQIEERRETISQTETKTETGEGGETAAGTAPEAHDDDGRKRRAEQAHYTIPLSTLLPDPTPVIIRREDGFEKRVLLRCGRCRVVVGYNLPSQHHNNTTSTAEEDVDTDIDIDDEENELGLTTKGKGERVIYILPGSIVGTEDLDVGSTEPDGTGGEGGAGSRRGDVLNAMIDRNPVLKGMEGEWMEWIK